MSNPSEKTVQGNMSEPIKCKNNCGFFGNQATDNYCSCCWKDVQKKLDNNGVTPLLTAIKTNVEVPKIPSSSPSFNSSPALTASSPNLTAISALSPMQSPITSPIAVKNKNRCAECNKKLSLASAFTCRCDMTYCSAHRLAEEHKCTFDFKSAERDTLRKQNPVIAGSKIDKI